MTLSAISRRLVASSVLRRPPTRPSARAAARPAEVRSRIMARSNSAKAATICIIIRPADVVVSMSSVSERKPAPALPIRSMMCSTSLSERDSRSSFQTTTMSPSRSWSSMRCSSGRSQRPPEAASSKIRRQPGAPWPAGCSSARHPWTPAHSQTAGRGGPARRLSQTVVCAWDRQPRQVLRICLSIPCFRMPPKGKRDMKGRPPANRGQATMSRRALLSGEQRLRLFAIPVDPAEMARHYVLSAADLALIRTKRRPSNRLGFAVQLCAFRYPGRGLAASEAPPAPMLAFVAGQLGIDPALFADYAYRPETRREHMLELREYLRLRSFRLADWRACLQVGAE